MEYSHTKGQTWQKCKRLYGFRYWMHLQPREKPSYLTEGELYHRAEEAFYDPTNERVPEHERIDLISHIVSEEAKGMEIDQSSIDAALRAFERSHVEPWEYPIVKVYSAEQQIVVPFHAYSIIVKADLLVDIMYQGKPRIAVIENKTSSGIGSNLINTYKHSPQRYQYAWGWSQAMKKPVTLTYFNVVSKAKRPTVSVWRECLEVEPESLMRWERSTFHIINDIVKTLEYMESTNDFEESFPQNMDSCHTILQGQCPFWPICYYHTSIPEPSAPVWTAYEEYKPSKNKQRSH